MQKKLSLKARAMAWLAQREHSRSELRRKLLRVAREAAAERAAQTEGEGAASSGDGVACADPAVCVDRLLDWLQAHGYLSEARFVESRIHTRAARYGHLRIQQELAQHGLVMAPENAEYLRATEFARAREICQRKFGLEAPNDPKERARQMRFLAGRGFSSDVVRRVVRGDPEA